MGRMGTAALAVGERDLALGASWLSAEAAAAGVPLLAANLVRADGTRPFPASRTVETGGGRVGILAVAARGAYPDGLAAADPVPAAREQVAALRRGGAAVVVALLHMPQGDARALLGAVEGVDVAVVAHLARRVDPTPVGSAILSSVGERGSELGRVVVWPGTRGAWADAGAPRKAEEELAAIRRAMDVTRARLARTEAPAARATILDVLGRQEERARDAERRMSARPRGRLYDGGPVILDDAVGEDPAVAAEVAAAIARFGAPPADPDDADLR